MGKKLSKKEQVKLRKKAKKELERMEKILENENVNQLIDRFKTKFNLCESCYKEILLKHQEDKGRKVTKSDLKLNMKQVKAALDYAGYIFEDASFLDNLFGSSSTQGYKSAKIHRNEVTHGIKKSAVEEIQHREAELFGYMDTFINIIRTFDDEKEAA